MKVMSKEELSFLHTYNACFLIIIDVLHNLFHSQTETCKHNQLLSYHLFLKCLEKLFHCLFQTVHNLLLLVEN